MQLGAPALAAALILVFLATQATAKPGHELQSPDPVPEAEAEDLSDFDDDLSNPPAHTDPIVTGVAL